MKVQQCISKHRTCQCQCLLSAAWTAVPVSPVSRDDNRRVALLRKVRFELRPIYYLGKLDIRQLVPHHCSTCARSPSCIKILSDRNAAWSQRNAKARATALAKRLAAKTTLIDQSPPSDADPVPPASISPVPVPHMLKRPALDAITNQPAKRATRRSAPVPLASVSEVSASFQPA